jgi:hypothetical protein
MESGDIVVMAPLSDECLGLLEAGEDFAIRRLVTQLALPGASRLDVEYFGAHARQPATHDLAGNLWAVVGSDVLGRPRIIIASAISAAVASQSSPGWVFSSARPSSFPSQFLSIRFAQ